MAGGDRGGCTIVSLKISVPFFVSHPERAPTASVVRIQNAYVFQFCFFIFQSPHNRICNNCHVYSKKCGAIGLEAIRQIDKWLPECKYRLATIESADQILVIDGGTVIQQGTYQELIQQEGRYKEFIGIREQAEDWRILWIWLHHIIWKEPVGSTWHMSGTAYWLYCLKTPAFSPMPLT